jgi:SAM-dependent methyltransferase
MDADRLARFYRWIEYAAFGRALESARFALLDRLQGCRRVLVLGEGDGRALERMLAVAPVAEFEVIESSRAMIALARQRVGNCERVRFFCEDARSVRLGRYDALVTCFFLDCFSDDELPRVVKRLASALVPGGLWLNAEFAIPKGGWARFHAAAWIWVMYRFFNVATGLRARTLPKIPEALVEYGMRSQTVSRRRWGMIVSEEWRLTEQRSNLPRTDDLLRSERLDVVERSS